MKNKKIYALLIGVGDYEEIGATNLPTYKMDLSLLGTSLLSGLKVPKENLRLMAGNENDGYIAAKDFARVLAGFRSLLGAEDTFLFYFSGHGWKKHLLFSDESVKLQSVIDIIAKLPAKNKIVILDCCYSGNFQVSGARKMYFEHRKSEKGFVDSCEEKLFTVDAQGAFYKFMDSFAGHGIAVMASSAADEVSRLGPKGNHSMFTGALSTAIALKKRVSKGKTSLHDIYDATMRLVSAWNRENPGKEQQPIFRESLGGTIYFSVEEECSYVPREYSFENDEYKIVCVQPLSTANIKRLCAFVIPKVGGQVQKLPALTKKIAEQLKYAEIYSSAKSEAILGGQPTKAVWCYFGQDESDIVNHLHYAYTIWTCDEKLRALYFKPQKDAVTVEDIYIYENKSYHMLKKMQEPTQTRKSFIEANQKLLAMIVTLAEAFVTDLQEAANQILTLSELQKRYGTWAIQVKKKYIELSEGDIAPNDLHEWAEEITNLAGWVVDMAVLIEKKPGNEEIGNREKWLIKNAVKRYYESMEKIKVLEAEIEWEKGTG